MPTYLYECIGCAHRFEIIRSISEQSEMSSDQKCPKCGQPSLQDYSGISFRNQHSNPIANDDTPYMDTALDEVITSRRQRKYLLEKHGLRVKEEGSEHDQKVRMEDMQHESTVKQKAKKSPVIQKDVPFGEFRKRMNSKKFVREVVSESIANRT